MSRVAGGGARVRDIPLRLTCQACQAEWEYEKAGKPPKVCHACRDAWRWCTKCAEAKPRTEFYRGTKVSRCIACCARAKARLTCAACGIDFLRTNRGGRTHAKRSHLCDACEVRVKWCMTCDEVKPKDAFGPAPDKRDGRQGRCRDCRKAIYAKRDVRARRAVVAKRYGMTLAQWDAMYLAQGGLCAICSQPPAPNSRGLAVDHDHTTGEVRALLCQPCNLGLGFFADSPMALRAAADYIERMAGLRSDQRGGQMR